MTTKGIAVHYEYSDSDCWDTGLDQPGHFGGVREALRSAQAHLNKPSSNCQTRVRLIDCRPGYQRERTLADYGYSDSGWQAIT